MVDEKKNADEMLTDEELYDVAGGTWENVADDANKFKREFGIDLVSDLFQTVPQIDDVDYYVRSNLIDAFRKFGVKMEFYHDSENKYYINGEEATREEAFNQVKIKLGK